MSVRSVQFIMFFESSVYSLIFYLVGLSIIEDRVLKSAITVFELPISLPFCRFLSHSFRSPVVRCILPSSLLYYYSYTHYMYICYKYNNTLL